MYSALQHGKRQQNMSVLRFITDVVQLVSLCLHAWKIPHVVCGDATLLFEPVPRHYVCKGRYTFIAARPWNIASSHADLALSHSNA